MGLMSCRGSAGKQHGRRDGADLGTRPLVPGSSSGLVPDPEAWEELETKKGECRRQLTEAVNTVRARRLHHLRFALHE